MQNLSKYTKIKEILELYSEAQLLRKLKKSFHVTEIARALASPCSHHREDGAKVGREAHSVLWNLDPYAILQYDRVSTPYPLAFRIGEYVVFGVADLVEFIKATPTAVYEFKSYTEQDRYSVVQTQIYAYLCSKCFEANVKAYLILGWNGKSYREKVEVEWNEKEVDMLIREALVKIISRFS